MGKVKTKAKGKAKAGKSAAPKKGRKATAAAAADKGADGKDSTEEKKPARFSRPELFTRPKELQALFAPFAQTEVSAEIGRPRLQTESIEHGRGHGLLRNFTFRKFREETKAVVFMNAPSSRMGGSFEPTDRLLTPGEQMRLTYTAVPEDADRPIYFLAKGYFLRKSFYVAEDPSNPGKPWTGSREDAVASLPKDVVVGGDDIIEIRIDTVNSFPGGPGRTDRQVLERSLSQTKLYIFPGGGGWNQKSTQGNFFKNIRDPLDKYLQREDVKVLEGVTLDEFSNVGEVAIMIKESLLEGVEDDVARPAVIKKPNDFVGEINNKLGFLLECRMDENIAELLARTFPKKAGKEDIAYLPLILDQVADAREQYRVTFRVFPRDLVEERGRKSMERGLKFAPPYALHDGPENQTTFSKLLILLNQRFREDERPEDEKLKSEKLKASVDKRIAERKGAFVDEKLKAAFQDRVSSKKRKDES